MKLSKIISLSGLAICSLLSSYSINITRKFPTTSNMVITAIFVVAAIFSFYLFIRSQKSVDNELRTNNLTPVD